MSTNTRNVAPAAASTTRTAILALGRRMERFEGESRPYITRADMLSFQTQVSAQLRAAHSIMGPEGAPMSEQTWRECWQRIGDAARAWERMRREWTAPGRVLTQPFRLAIDQAQQVYEAAAEIAPRLGLAAAGGMVIASLAGLWLLSEIFGGSKT